VELARSVLSILQPWHLNDHHENTCNNNERRDSRHYFAEKKRSEKARFAAKKYQNNIRIFDYAKFAEPYRDELKQNGQPIAEEASLEIEYIGSSGVRKEAVIESIIKKRRPYPGLVHIIPVMEACTSYKP
jgi:hypothetical protein